MPACFRMVCGLGLVAGVLLGQAPEPKPAEQVFKNIIQLKGTPADQLVPAMQFISAEMNCIAGTN
jgi:hypothetical protein